MRTITYFTQLCNASDKQEHPTKEAAHEAARVRSLELLAAHLARGGEIETTPSVYVWTDMNDVRSCTESWKNGVCFGPHGMVNPFEGEGVIDQHINSMHDGLNKFLENY